MTAASIRTNNPGAMWGKGNPVAKLWGSTSTSDLNDGLGQGNNIAYFPTKVQGAAAQFDLWRSSKHYRNKTLAEGLKAWSGGNSTASYIKFITDRVPGMTPQTVITETLLRSPTGIAMMKAQAWHEAGQPYPMTDAEWLSAQRLVFGKPPVEKPAEPKAPHAPAAGAVIAGTAVAMFSWDWRVVVLGFALGLLAAFIIYKMRK